MFVNWTTAKRTIIFYHNILKKKLGFHVFTETKLIVFYLLIQIRSSYTAHNFKQKMGKYMQSYLIYQVLRLYNRLKWNLNI